MEEKDERIEYINRITSKYGMKRVSASRVYEIAEKVLQPNKMGLLEIRPGYYGKKIDQNIIHLLNIHALKGASYELRWGCSLTFMPHKWTTKLQWHRTVKSAMFDIWEIAFEYLGLHKKHWFEAERFIANSLYGEHFLQEKFEDIQVSLTPIIKEWFRKSESLSGILRIINEQSKRIGKSKHHFPPLPLVRAFTLCRMNKLNVARSALETYLRESQEYDLSCRNLLNAFELIIDLPIE